MLTNEDTEYLDKVNKALEDDDEDNYYHSSMLLFAYRKDRFLRGICFLLFLVLVVTCLWAVGWMPHWGD